MSRPRGNLAGDGGVAGRLLCHRCGEFRHLGRDCFHNTRRRRPCCFCRESTHSSLDCQRIRLIKSLVKEPKDNRSSGGSGDGSINHDTETRNTGSEGVVVVEISSSSSSDDDEEDEGKLLVGKNNTDSLDVKGRVKKKKSRDAKGKEVEEKRVDGESLRNWNHNSGGSCKHSTHMGSGGPIVIEISSSSSGEEDDDDYDVNNGDSNKVEEEGWFSNKKHTAFLSMKLRVKEESKKVEEDDDNECVVLDFDPFQSPTVDFKSKISLSDHDDEDVSITTERGQVACRDYPHSRQHCAEYPFSKTVHENCCPQCHCYVCDVVAPCEHWKGSTGHCHASDHEGMWKAARMFAKFDLHISGPD